MNKSEEEKTFTNQGTENHNHSPGLDFNLGENRAAVLEKHLNKNKATGPSEKELEIKRIKEEINKLKKSFPETNHQAEETNSDEYARLVQKVLFEFRNEINSPINSIEYSSESLKLEYERVINYFTLLADSAYPTEALGRTIDYVNTMVNLPDDSLEAVELRERKKVFVALLQEYEFRNANKAADYFISAGIYYIDDELYWIFSQPKAEVLFDLMISILSIRQSFEVLNSAKSRTRFLTANLIIPSDKGFINPLSEESQEDEKEGDIKLKRQFISDELKPVIKMIIILLNLFVIFKILFHF